MAYEQFALNGTNQSTNHFTNKGSIQVEKTADKITISGKDFSIVFDAVKGIMQSYTYQKQELIQNGPTPSFWRAPTDNDLGAGFNHSQRVWREAYASGKIVEFTSNKKEDGSIVLTIKKEILNGDAIQEQVYTVYSGGVIKVENNFQAIKGKYPLLMRYGNDLQLNVQFNNMEWYGRGPGESYWDRKSGSLVGLYKQTVKEQYFSYARPQESGNKSDTRWVKFTNQKGKGLKVLFEDSLLNISALPYSLHDLDPEENKKQYHSGELIERNEIYLHIDQQQSGLQGMDSWGAWPLEQYRIPFKNHSYRYWITPL
jgi:beta-galactosidase